MNGTAGQIHRSFALYVVLGPSLAIALVLSAFVLLRHGMTLSDTLRRRQQRQV